MSERDSEYAWDTATFTIATSSVNVGEVVANFTMSADPCAVIENDKRRRRGLELRDERARWRR